MNATHANSRFRFSLRSLLLLFVLVAVAIVVYPTIRRQYIEREMLANTTAQLDDDILSYEWLHAIARYHEPSGNSRQHCELIRTTIHKLVEQDAIVIGPMSSGSTIRPWSGSKADQLSRVDAEIERIGFPTTERDRFGFWIGLPSAAWDGLKR